MQTPETQQPTTVDSLPYFEINDLDSAETYRIIKPEFAAKYASAVLKRMAEVNRREEEHRAALKAVRPL